MTDFLKKIGKGLITIVLSPIGAILFAIASVCALLTFVWQLIKAIFLFFSGKSIFDPSRKDRLAEAILAGDITPDQEVRLRQVEPKTPPQNQTPNDDLSSDRIDTIPTLEEAKTKKVKTWSLEDITDEEGEKL